MVETSKYQVLTHAGQPVGSGWAKMWANMWAHYWSYTNGICYQRVTLAPDLWQALEDLV